VGYAISEKVAEVTIRMTKLDKIMFTVVPGVLVEWELVVVFRIAMIKKDEHMMKVFNRLTYVACPMSGRRYACPFNFLVRRSRVRQGPRHHRQSRQFWRTVAARGWQWKRPNYVETPRAGTKGMAA